MQADELILEGIVTTVGADGALNIAPMGPRVDREMTHLLLRPFRTSQTYQNLKHSGEAVFHVTDDIELIAQAAVGLVEPPPRLIYDSASPCPILADACRWYALRVVHMDDSMDRTTIQCEVKHRGELRHFFGFNRAKHAVLELAILATRIGIVPNEQVQDELQRLAVPIEKTAGHQERRAFAFLQAYIEEKLAGKCRSMHVDARLTSEH